MSNQCHRCRLHNPPGKRQCVCGASLVPEWKRQEEQESRGNARRRTMDTVWQVLAAIALGGILYGLYLFSATL